MSALNILDYTLNSEEERKDVNLTPLEYSIARKVINLDPQDSKYLADEVDINMYRLLPFYTSNNPDTKYSIYYTTYLNPLLKSKTNEFSKVVKTFATLKGYMEKYPNSSNDIFKIFLHQQRRPLTAYMKSIVISLQDLSGAAVRYVPVDYRRRHLPTSIINEYAL